MGWFRRRNETAGWESAVTPLVLDLDRLQLNDTTCGDSVDGLAFLGPGMPGLLSGEYVFHSRGVTLGLNRGQVASFHVHFRPTEDDPAGMLPFRGVVRHRGAPIDPNNIVGVGTAVARFGVPEAGEQTATSRILTYDADGTEWELALGKDGVAAAVGVYGAK